MKISRRSLVLLLLQLAIVSSIAAKYLYERQHCPRVWARAVAYDPELVFRGRYLSMQLHVDACGITLPPQMDNHPMHTGEDILFDQNGVGIPYLEAHIGAKNGKLSVTALTDTYPAERDIQRISIRQGSTCDQAFLTDPIDFFIPEHAESPFPLKQSSALWVEVTLPPKGPPRPVSLALNDNGQWKPLSF